MSLFNQCLSKWLDPTVTEKAENAEKKQFSTTKIESCRKRY